MIRRRARRRERAMALGRGPADPSTAGVDRAAASGSSSSSPTSAPATTAVAATTPAAATTTPASGDAVPEYKPSTVTSSEHVGGAGKMVLTSPDSAEKVTAFYENALQSGGWQVEKTTKSGDTVRIQGRKRHRGGGDRDQLGGRGSVDHGEGHPVTRSRIGTWTCTSYKLRMAPRLVRGRLGVACEGCPNSPRTRLCRIRAEVNDRNCVVTEPVSRPLCPAARLGHTRRACL